LPTYLASYRKSCYITHSILLANVNVRYMLSPVRPSSVGNARAPYSGCYNFLQYFNGIWYLGHPLTST